VNDVATVPTRPVPPDGAGGPSLLSVRDLGVAFATSRGLLHAVRDVSLTLEAGRTLGIVGESGSGKSVLARAIMNLLPPAAETTNLDRVHFDGRALHQLSREEARHFWGVHVAMVFQDPMTSLTPVMRIGQQLVEPLRYHLGLSRADAWARAVELLRRVGIPDPERRARQHPHNLSGGMRQRVTIAIALSCQPRVLICDEPTTALDVTVQQQVLNLLADAQHELGMGMILVTHDLGVVAGRADDISVMYAGRIVEHAPATELFAAPRHPYTVGLLRSVPRLENPPHQRFAVIPGRASPAVGDRPGCTFAPRCTYAQPRCLVTTPSLTTIDASIVPAGSGDRRHQLACFYPVGTDAGRHALDENRLRGATPTGLRVTEVDQR
jgi:peptide/nickel transport system ATP-binding protein